MRLYSTITFNNFFYRTLIVSLHFHCKTIMTNLVKKKNIKSSPIHSTIVASFRNVYITESGNSASMARLIILSIKKAYPVRSSSIMCERYIEIIYHDLTKVFTGEDSTYNDNLI